ncbi:hypothetical protein LGK97_19205 [Clostridium sp. CS001]|uniref:hypothetical protein n=1 Tax=Clostridium sp. CS001 TaxID=2880648 RepID=UPI001CF2255B|nr:hypothetical protein [Clostridium sp. CS001]MCB2291835.1 hypothetical protein [Clostridium sp. CS001]
MSQNKSIVAKNQNFIPNSQGVGPNEGGNVNVGIAEKNQTMAATSQDSRNAENGYKNNSNASVQAANHGTRNKN